MLFKRLMFDAVSFAYLVAVVLVATLMPSEETLLNLKQNSLILLGLVFVGLFISQALNKVGLKTLGELLFEPPHKKIKDSKSMFKTFWGWQLTVLFVVTFVVGMIQTRFSLIELLDVDGWEGAKRLFMGLATPNWSILGQALLSIIDTIYLAFIATVLAIPVAFVMSFLCAKNIMDGNPVTLFIYGFLRSITNIVRSVEALIWAIIFSVWVGIGPFAGMLALLVHSVASLVKQYSEIVECVDEGPIEGVKSTGANSLQVIWFGVVPQIVLPYISFTIFRWDINVRMATIIGLVGGGGIGNMLIQYQGQALWNEVGTIIIVIAIAVWVMDAASTYIREAIK